MEKDSYMDIFYRVSKFNLPVGQYAVFGSALLDVWGLRSAQDLDIIVTPELYEQLRGADWEEIQANGFTILRKEDADITTLQEKATDGGYNPDRLQLIREAVMINDIPFVRIEDVIACKTAYNRPKDLQDIKLITEYLARQNQEGNE